MNITKIKFDGYCVEVGYTEGGENLTAKKIKVHSDEPADKNFILSAFELLPIVTKALNFSPDWLFEDMTLNTITIGFQVTGSKVCKFNITKKCEHSSSAMKIETCNFYEEGAHASFSKPVWDKMYRVLEHAIDFVNGKRAQEDMFNVTVSTS